MYEKKKKTLFGGGERRRRKNTNYKQCFVDDWTMLADLTDDEMWD